MTHVQVNNVPATGYRIQITAEGPFGALEPLDYPVNVNDIRFNLKTPPGTLNGIAIALEKSTKALVQAIKEQRP